MAGKKASVAVIDKNSITSKLPEYLGELRVAESIARFNDSTIYLTLAKRVIESENETANKIEAALSKGEYVEATRFAHSLKGIASYIGAPNLTKAAGELEDALRESDMESVPALLPAVKTLLAKVIEDLDQLVNLNKDK
jgi:HPt (histidine-containing phosphotransfer) domain-containing protein